MRIAVVAPRYGLQVLGGAEKQARGFVEIVTQKGLEVEVWTTCAQSHYTWENFYEPGVESNNGIIVRRFPITHWEKGRWAELEVRLATQSTLTADESYSWLASGPHSVPLYEYVSRHSIDFDVVIALPYTMPLIHYAAWSALDRVVLWPCLHHEPYAYLEPVRLLLESVWGVMFNSPEEADLAIRRLRIKPRHHAVLGEGVTLAADAPDTLEKERFGTFILYVGRLEEGKNLYLLYDYMQRYFQENKGIRLVVIGDGPAKPPDHPAFVYLGFVSEGMKAALYRAALVLCQPSLLESFSLTIMEAWLSSRPVLVHEDCAVTLGHVQRSGGGLWFRSYEDFALILDRFRAHPELGVRMGENGNRYVLQNYTWEAVLNRFLTLFQSWREQDDNG